MNDTHGETGRGWYGFDLDGTLAKYDGWRGIDHIGEPVKPMVDLIKRMHGEGKVVKVMTDRVAPKEKPEVKPNPYLENHWVIESPDDMPWAVHAGAWTPREFIQDWCDRFLGFVPDIVYQKDHLMTELYDDRVKQVVPNEGWLVEDIARSKRQRVETTIVKREVVNCKWYDRLNSFLFGMGVMTLITVAIQAYLSATVTVPEAERKLRDAVGDYMQSKIDERVSGLLK